MPTCYSITCTVGAKKILHFVSVAWNERSAKTRTKRKRNGDETIKRKHETKKNRRWKTEISERTCKLHDRDREMVNKEFLQ